MPIHHVAPALALVIGAVVTLLTGLALPPRRQGWCAGLALVALVVAAGAAAWLQSTQPAALTFSGTWALDGITAAGTLIITSATGVVVLLSPRWLATDARHGEWYVMLLLSALGALLMVGAADLLELLVAVLLSSTTGYTLASFHRASRASAEAGAKYFLLGALANPLLLLGIVLLYGLAGDTAYTAVRATLTQPGLDPWVASAAVALIVVGLAFKLGAAPAHPWVPDVAEGAPAPAAAFLTVVPKVGALLALYRLAGLLPEEGLAWRPLLASLALVTMTLGNLAALFQDDLRRLLGWSSVSQAGYGLMAVVAVGRSGLSDPALVLFLVGYGAAQLASFSVVVALRGRTRLADYRGLAAARPGMALVLVLALLSLAGVPPLVGFVAKLALFGAVLDAGYGWLGMAAVINTVVSFFYYLRVVGPMYVGTPGRVADLGPLARFAAILTAALVVLGGLGAQAAFGAS